MTGREFGQKLTPFAGLLKLSTNRARVAASAKSPTPAPSAKRQAAAPDSHAAAVGGSSFTHLLGRGHLLAAHAAVEPATAAPRPARTREDDAQAHAEFIGRSAAKARGEIPIPRQAPRTADERVAQSQADFIGASAAKARPSLYGGEK